ncbi:MAG: alpha/beta fold hydrolase [Actinomycetota bacterium]
MIVPLDHDDPGGSTIEIAVAQVGVSGAEPLTAEPILRLQGGPGGGITDSVGRWADGDLRELFGAVLIEYRGEPNSSPALSCPGKWEAFIENHATVDPFEVEADRIADAAGQCAARASADGIDLDHFDTAAIADDIELVRQALGVDEWNLVGVSYGTTVAMEVMRRHPDSVRTSILDSAYPPERATIADVWQGLDHLLDRYDAVCPPRSSCNPTDGAFSERFLELVEQYDVAPLATALTNPMTGDTFDAMLDGGDFVNAMWLAVWSANLPELVADAVTTDNPASRDDLVVAATQQFLADYGDSSLLQADVVECRDRGARVGRETIDAAVDERPEFSTVFQYATYVGHGIACDRLGAAQQDDTWTDPLGSDIPTLVLAGVWDAVTPPEWGRALLDGLSNGRFYEYPGLAHGTWDDTDCSFSITQQFLSDPTAEIDASCIDAMTDQLS